MANTRVTNPVTGFNSATEEGLKLPSGTNANQPSGVQGMIRNDTGETTGSSASAIEHHNGTNWQYFAATESADNPFLASQNFNTVLYTGNGGTNDISSVGFQPDLVWVKNRSTGDPAIFSSLMSNNKTLFTNSASAQATLTGGSLSMDTNGFDINTYGATFLNANLQSYVAWCFKAGGAAVSNTDGTLASQVSANAVGGFSIVKWSGNNTTGGTIGHGLSSTPELTIIKKTSGAAADWQVSLNASVTGVEGYMNFNKTAGLYTTYPLYYTSSNSTVLSSNGTSTATRLYNNQSENYIAYCFHSVPGYSKVGSYTGTGAGTTITTGFQPAFVMIKKTSGSADWIIFNDKTGSNILKPNTNASEVSLTNYITYNSTGFTFPTGDSNINTGDFIFMSFA